MRRSLPVSIILRLMGLLAVLALALAVLWQARRPDPAAGQERSDRLAGALDSTHTLSQTFTAGQDDLCAIDVFPRIPPGRLNPRYGITLHLRETGAARDLAAARFSLVDARARQKISFAFPPQPGSLGKSYLLLVETDAPPDTVSLLSSSEDSYYDGTLLLDGQDSVRDLTFRTYSALVPRKLVHELVQAAPEYGRLLLFALLFGAAGWSLLTLLGWWPDSGIAERGLWAVGTGLALAPLVYLLVGRSAGWALAGLFLLAFIRLGLKGRKAGWGTSSFFSSRITQPLSACDWAIPALFLWALAVRVLQIRDVPAPMWVDGLSHVQMVQAILDAGRMPAGLLYHIGFHTQAALLYPLSGLLLPRLIILLGQLVSALNGPALYVLAKRLVRPGGSEPDTSPPQTVALLAALALAVFPSLPAYLINWGRYPFLLGLTQLPFTLAATIDALRLPPARVSLARYGLMIILLAGMLLCHYGMFSFWLSFTLVLLLVERPAWLRRLHIGRLAAGLLALFVLAFAAGYLRFGDNLMDKIASTIAESRQTSQELDYASIWQINLRAGGLWLILTGAAALLWAAAANRRLLFLTGGWFLAQAVLIAAQSPFFGFAIASYANLLLALSLPLAALVGWLMERMLELPVAIAGNGSQGWKPRAKKTKPNEPLTRARFLSLAAFRPKHEGNGDKLIIHWLRFFSPGLPALGTIWRAAGILAALLLALAGGLTQIGILNPAALLYGPTDQQATDWIKVNLPNSSRFLINSRFWSASQIVPADGGGWIPAMTGNDAVSIQDRSQLARLPEFIRQEKIGFIYLGRFSGFLSRSFFAQDPSRYRRIYHLAGIDIYAVVQR